MDNCGYQTLQWASLSFLNPFKPYTPLLYSSYTPLKPWSDVILLRSFLSLLAKTVCSTFFPSTNTVTNTHNHAVRDSFETPKQDIEGRLSQILGQPWTIKVDPLALYAYAEEDSWASTSLGDLIVRFVPHVFLCLWLLKSSFIRLYSVPWIVLTKTSSA